MVTRFSSFELKTSSGSLILTDFGSTCDWWRVELVTEGQRALGAEALTPIVRRLGTFLRDETPGQRWVLSLGELHTTIYGEHLMGGVVLKLRDAEARFFATLVLTEEEKLNWLAKISEIESASNRERVPAAHTAAEGQFATITRFWNFLRSRAKFRA